MPEAAHREGSWDRAAPFRPRPRARARQRVDREGSVRLPVLLPEALNASSGVDELLLAREERVADVTDVGMDLRDRGARLECVTARALHGRGCIFGVDIGFHGNALNSSRRIAGKYTLSEAQKTRRQ